MAKDYDSERLIVKYLLGELSGRERAEFEQAYLADDRLFDEVRAVEDELFDDYAQNNLSERERRLFEQNLLRSPEAARRLSFVRAFNETLSHTLRAPVRAVPGPLGFKRKRLILTAAVAAAVVLTLCGALVLFFNARRSAPRASSDNHGPTPTPLARQTPEAEVNKAAQGEAHPQDAPTSASNTAPPNPRRGQSRSLFAFTLRPAGTRGQSREGGEGVLNIPRAAERVSLRMRVEADEYTSYRAVIRTAEGVEVLTVSALRPRPAARDSREVSIEVSAERLAAGDYTLALSGLASPGRYEDVDDFYFSVVRR